MDLSLVLSYWSQILGAVGGSVLLTSLVVGWALVTS